MGDGEWIRADKESIFYKFNLDFVSACSPFVLQEVKPYKPTGKDDKKMK